MSQSNVAAASLLSLSMAAAAAAPIPVHHHPTSDDDLLETPVGSPGATQTVGSGTGTHRTHRRLASTGRSRRRLSDAREAAARPS
ncbi:hypothetical protein Ac2012v2_007305 [Leucoagaricus gongylophorus]